MNIPVTGAIGFVGKNLCAALGNIRDGNDRSTELELLYIDDLAREMLDALENDEQFDPNHPDTYFEKV